MNAQDRDGRAIEAARFNAHWLMEQEFPPIQYVVPGIIPEGMSILVAAPKIGKSWMVLGLAHALSDGGDAFGRIPIGKPRPVLYLALEDGQRRLQARLRSIGADPTDLLEFVIDVAGTDPVALIRDYILENEGHNPVVVLDTLGKIKPPTGAGNAYAEDYGFLAALKACVDAVPGSSLLIVHHSRKADASDFVDAVSGTQGVAGAADTVLLLKRVRGENKAVMYVTSRDAAEGEYALTLSDAGIWELDGADITEAAHAAQASKAADGTGGDMTDLLIALSRHPEGITPKNLSTELVGWDDKKTSVYLARAAATERALKVTRGFYKPVGTVGTVGTSSTQTALFNTPNTPNTHMGENR